MSGNGVTTFDRAFAPYGEKYLDFYSGNDRSTDFTGDTQEFTSWLSDTPNRELNNSQGRWESPDPAGSGWNAYAYGTDPNGGIDPTGLEMCCWGGSTGGQVAFGMAGCDPDHMDCGSSGGSPSDPSAGGHNGADAMTGANGNDPSSFCPICTRPWGSLGTAGIDQGFFSFLRNYTQYGGSAGGPRGLDFIYTGRPGNPIGIPYYLEPNYLLDWLYETTHTYLHHAWEQDRPCLNIPCITGPRPSLTTGEIQGAINAACIGKAIGDNNAFGEGSAPTAWNANGVVFRQYTQYERPSTINPSAPNVNALTPLAAPGIFIQNTYYACGGK